MTPWFFRTLRQIREEHPDALLHMIDQWERDNVAVRLDQDEKLRPLIPTGIDRKTGAARRRRLARRQQLRSSSEVGEHASPPLTPPGPGLLGAAGTARQAPSHSAPGRAGPPAGCSPVRVHGRRVRQTGIGVGRDGATRCEGRSGGSDDEPFRLPHAPGACLCATCTAPSTHSKVTPCNQIGTLWGCLGVGRVP